MVSAVFRRAVREATGIAWEKWVARLKQTVDPSWSHERMKGHICETYRISDEWGEWLAVLYGQAALGRTPVGVTKDAGVQIGVRRTWEADRGRLWHFLAKSDEQVKYGNRLTLEGIVGVRVVVKALFVSLTYDFTSARYSHSWVFRHWNEIEDYWQKHAHQPLTAANADLKMSG